VGLLVAAGVDASTATAAALLHRAADKGVNTLVGVGALAFARRRRRRLAAEAERRGEHEAVSLPREAAEIRP
jgi:uncharacterized membrane protein YbhN (UPF0104 family)